MQPAQHISKADDTINGVNVKYFKTRVLRPRFPFLISHEMKIWLQRNIARFDVVHIHFARDWIPITIAQAALRAGVPIYLQPHGMLGRRDGIRKILDYLLIARLLRRVDGVFVLQEHEQKNVKAISSEAKTILFPNGIELSSDMPHWQPEMLNNRKILFLARLHPRKRVLDFIDAAKLLLERNHDVSFRIVGPDGGDLSKARKRVEAYKINKAVEFVGPIDLNRVPYEYANASVYVLPSVDEPFPMSVLEALAVGIPTVGTQDLHIHTLLDRYNAAVIVKSKPEALAESISYVLENPELAIALSNNGRHLIENKLRLEQVIECLDGIYQRKNIQNPSLTVVPGLSLKETHEIMRP
jgi:glycosyltransferase involved in cell wall biosynthesis